MICDLDLKLLLPMNFPTSGNLAAKTSTNAKKNKKQIYLKYLNKKNKACH